MTQKKKSPALGFRQIAIEKITPPQVAVRIDVTPESVADLAESIKKIGLIEPLIVRPVRDKFEVVAGHRRLTACKVAGLAKVKCLVVSVSDEESEAIKHHENHVRLSVSPVEQAIYFSYLIDKKGMKQNEIAELFSVSEGFVSQRLALLNWHEELVAAVDAGQISFSSARELARITDDQALLAHLQQAIEHGVTPRVANMWWQDWLKNQAIDTGRKVLRGA